MADRGAKQIGGVGLKCTGALAGTVFVDSLEASVGSLRAEILRLMSGNEGSVKLIVGGRTLQDDSKRLCDCGITAASRVLVARGGAGDAAAAAANAAAERAARLEGVRKAAEALAGRDGRGLSDDLDLEIEDQAGARVAVKPEDRRHLVFGLVMHDKAKDTMGRGDWAAALDELLLAEESLGLCDPALTAAVDNVALLLLDLVWAAYKLGDLRRLAVSRDRLCRARAGLERAHGADLQRLRSLTGGGFSPELATYLRLEVLEGLVAFYGGEPAATAESAFRGAQAKWRRLQVADGALAMLQGMGYDMKESRRGLRFSGGDVAAAVDFIQEQRAKQQERDEKRRKVHSWNYERLEYGKTAAGQYVDMEQLDKLEGLGYPRRLAAEALRKHENRGQEALDELAKPERRRALELELSLKEALKTSKAEAKAKAKAGPSDAAAAAAAAADAGAGPSTSAAAAHGQDTSGSAGANGSSSSAAVNPAALEALKTLAEALAASKAGGAGAAGSKLKGQDKAGAAATGGGSAAMDVDDETAAVLLAAAMEDTEGGGAGASTSPGEGGGGKEAEEEEDPVKAAEKAELKAAERELVRHVESDPMAAYDIDVTEEGNIIAEFLTLLSTGGEGPAS
ncbi:hypothetical protein CHLRE_03g205650v5 [Chlamydomonas reinhardtii]|uniref:Ubiquitin-like domain-containing protein n=1 Tax=Chlamydomonas reinhardtii TaxID=3055 RepID=A0A2K3DZ26_CHLRE|nr:uncharacterized protein CHLRE_03g205650v5 [Chlamydomonas reinhardtii]PNW85783.1 hypothetical protein CHLRE_03g205650v5 [Chlamydomonas reinhardtii]